VDFEKAKEIAGSITPVSGGAVPMTITMLMKNTLNSRKFKLSIAWERMDNPYPVRRFDDRGKFSRIGRISMTVGLGTDIRGALEKNDFEKNSLV
jgi:hypothetical protein